MWTIPPSGSEAENEWSSNYAHFRAVMACRRTVFVLNNVTELMTYQSSCSGRSSFLQVKVKQPLYRPWELQELKTPRFQDSRQMKVVRLSVLRTGRLYPQEILLVLIFDRCWDDPRAMVRSEGLCQWQIPMTQSGMDRQCLKLRYRVPLLYLIVRLQVWRA
jgi:hypothetical protein